MSGEARTAPQNETPTSRAFRDAAKRMREKADEFRQLHGKAYEEAEDLVGQPALAAFAERREYLRLAGRCDAKAKALEQTANDLEGAIP